MPDADPASRIDLAEISHAQVSLGLDSVLRRHREAADDQLAVDKEGVRRAIDEMTAARVRLDEDPDHAPFRQQSPAKQLSGASRIEHRHSSDGDGPAEIVLLDDHGPAIEHLDDASHRGLKGKHGKQRDYDCESDCFHGIFGCRGEASHAAKSGLRWAA